MIRTIVALSATAAMLTACSAGSSDDASSKYKITFGTGDKSDQVTVLVDGDTEAAVQPAIEAAVDRIDSSKHDGGYFIYAKCSSGDRSVVGQARFAKGNKGAAEVGLDEGKYDFEFRQGATCKTN